MTRVQGGGQHGTGGHAKDRHDDGVCVKVFLQPLQDPRGSPALAQTSCLTLLSMFSLKEHLLRPRAVDHRRDREQQRNLNLSIIQYPWGQQQGHLQGLV